MPRRPALALLALVLALAACARGAPDLIRLDRGQQSPDEFSVLPSKPLEIPADLGALPPPAPVGSGSRTTPTPQADAVAALGGAPARLAPDGQSPDGALVAAASRYGRDAEVRATLAAEDLAFRERNRGRVLERVFRQSTYYRAYDGFALDRQAETERFRAAGRRTPAAPPAVPD